MPKKRSKHRPCVFCGFLTVRPSDQPHWSVTCLECYRTGKEATPPEKPRRKKGSA